MHTNLARVLINTQSQGKKITNKKWKKMYCILFTASVIVMACILISSATKHRILNQESRCHACILLTAHNPHTFLLNIVNFLLTLRLCLLPHVFYLLAFLRLRAYIRFQVSSSAFTNSNTLDLLLLSIVSTADSNDRNSNR